MIATVLHQPSLALTEDESRALAVATVRVTDLYDLPLMSEEARAWANLGLVGFNVYGTRIAAHLLESKRAREAAKAAAAQPQPQPAAAPMPIDAYQGARSVQ